MLRLNALKEKLGRGEVVLGCNVGPDPATAEILAGCGFDFLQIDGEHYPLTARDLEHVVRACESEGVTAVARMMFYDPRFLTPYLETGVLGLFLTHSEGAADAAGLVSATKYAPIGKRGMGSGRARNYGRIAHSQHMREWNEQMLACVILESPEALAEVDAFIETPGLDGIGVGLGDLSAGLGHPGDIHHPEVWAATKALVRKVRDAGKWCSVSGIDDVPKYIDIGVQMFKVKGQKLLQSSAEKYVAGFRSKAASTV